MYEFMFGSRETDRITERERESNGSSESMHHLSTSKFQSFFSLLSIFRSVCDAALICHWMARTNDSKKSVDHFNECLCKKGDQSVCIDFFYIGKFIWYGSFLCCLGSLFSLVCFVSFDHISCLFACVCVFISICRMMSFIWYCNIDYNTHFKATN